MKLQMIMIQASSGYLTLFNPSSTTYVKHFIATTNTMYNATSDFSIMLLLAGYGNTTCSKCCTDLKCLVVTLMMVQYLMYGIK
jgi:hypothetical protein